MRVLIVGLNYAPEPSGIAPYTAGFARSLAAAGHDVEVLTAFPHYPAWSFQPGAPTWRSTEMLGGVRVTRLRHILPVHRSSALRMLSELSFGFRALFARWGSPDVVVLVSPAMFASALVGLRAFRSRRTAVGVWVQDIYSLAIEETGVRDWFGLAERFVSAVERRLLRRADGVAVIHQHFLQTIDEMGVGPHESMVVRNWTHVAPLPASADRPAFRARMGWAEDETVLLHTGNMGAKQDLGNLVEVARLADTRDLPVRVVLMGDGNMRQTVEQEAAGVHRVQFLPPVDAEEYMTALAAADVLLVNEHPAMRSMALPSKLTSYFAAGQPVIAATHADSLTAQELEASGAGIRVDPAHPAALLEAVLALRGAPGQSRTMGDRGRHYQDSVLTERASMSLLLQWVDDLRNSPQLTRGREQLTARW